MGANFLRSIVSILLALVLMVPVATASVPQTLLQSVEELFVNGESSCSAVRISVDTYLTAAHCAPLEAQFIVTKKPADVVKVGSPDKVDLALLRVREVTPGPIMPIAKLEPDAGDEVISIGFAGPAQRPVTFFGHVMAGYYEEIGDRLLLDVHGGPGLSGGAVVSNGKLVGIVKGGTLTMPYLSYATRLKDIRKFLGV